MVCVVRDFSFSCRLRSSDEMCWDSLRIWSCCSLRKNRCFLLHFFCIKINFLSHIWLCQDLLEKNRLSLKHPKKDASRRPFPFHFYFISSKIDTVFNYQHNFFAEELIPYFLEPSANGLDTIIFTDSNHTHGIVIGKTATCAVVLVGSIHMKDIVKF